MVRTAGHRLTATIVAVLAALSAACGSSSGGGGGSNHDSPEGAVKGFVDAAKGVTDLNNLGPLLDWVAPSQRDKVKQGLSAVQSFGATDLKFAIQVTNFETTGTDIDSSDPNKAKVHVKGTVLVCYSGTIAGTPVSTCSPSSAGSAAGGTTGDTVDTLKEGGQWYVANFGTG